MCGPSTAQKNIAGSQASFMSQLQSSYAANFGAQSSIFQNLTNSLTPILNAGPNQQGFSAAENSALNAGAISSTAQQYKNAAVISGESRAGAGGGNTYLPSGADKQVQAGIASAAGQQLSSEQNQIAQADYATGRSNYFNALSGLSGVAKGYDPSAIAGNATNAGQAAFGSATQVQNMENQEESDIAGAVVGVAGSALTGGLSGLAGSAAGASQPGAFFGGALKGLGGMI